MTKNMTKTAYKRATAFDVSYCLMAFFFAGSFFTDSLLQALGA